MNESKLFEILNYEFRDSRLISQALTRQSAITEGITGSSNKTYQRLEFLGDSLLRLIVSDMIFSVFPDGSECEMTNLRISFEKNDFIGKIALNLGLGKFIKMGKGEELQKIRQNPKILADIFESIVAAIYLDSGSYDETKRVVLNVYREFIIDEPRIKGNAKRVDLFFKSLNTLSEVYEERRQGFLASYSIKPVRGPEVICEARKGSNFSQKLLNCIKNPTEQSLHNFLEVEKRNNMIDYELFSFFSSADKYSNILSDLRLLEVLMTKMKEYYYKLQLKSHYICAKILLHVIFLHKDSSSIILMTSITCLAHNGISEFFRQNLNMAKVYFEMTFLMLKESCLSLPEIKVLTTYYYSEFQELSSYDQYLNSLLDDKTILSLINSAENEVTLHIRIILINMKLRSRLSTLGSSSDNERKYLIKECLGIMKAIVKKYKTETVALSYVKLYFQRIEYGLYKIDIQKVKSFENDIMKNLGDKAVHLLFFYKFYSNNNFDIPENLLSQYIAVMNENFTTSSPVLTQELMNFTSDINIEE